MGSETSHDKVMNNYIHPRLGKIVRIQQAQSRQLIQYTVIVESSYIVEKWEQQIHQINNQVCRQFLFFPINHNFQKTGMCGTGGNVTLKYGDFMFTLEPQIMNRMEIKRPFQETQIWYMMYVLIKLESVFEKHNKKIGDIKPSNILVNEEGQLQIISQYSWPGQEDNFALSLQNSQQKYYLSPQECARRKIKKQASGNMGNLNKSQMFSIGLTILEACSLMDCSLLYSDKYLFNDHKLKSYTDVMEKKYSKILNKIVRSMLRINPSSRKSAGQIENSLIQYEDKLLGLVELEEEEKKNIQRILFKQSLSTDLSRKASMKEIERSPSVQSSRNIYFQSKPQQYPPIKQSLYEPRSINQPHFINMNQSVPIQTERPVNFNMLGDRPQSNNSSFYSFYSGKSFNRPKVIFNPGQY